MTRSCCVPFIQLWNFHRMLTTAIHQIDLWRRQRTNRVCYIWSYVFFSFRISIIFLLLLFFNQSFEMRLTVVVVCSLVTSSISLSLFSLLKQRWAEHTSFTSLTRQTLHHHHLHKYIYHRRSNPSWFVYVYIVERDREKKKSRDYNLAKEIFFQ